MCNFSKDIFNDGRIMGKLETIIELMKAQNISAEAACDLLGYDNEEKEKILELLKVR